MAINIQEQAFVMWEALYQLMKAEQNWDSVLGAGQGTNTAGRLQTVALVGKSIYPDFNSLPYIGVQLKAWKETLYGTNRRHQVHTEFDIVAVAAVEAGASSTYIGLQDAMAKLQTLVSDGVGNGITAILRDVNNYTLGGAATQTRITGCDLNWVQGPEGKGTDYVVYALVKFEALDFVQ